jgi:hypothetical protein
MRVQDDGARMRGAARLRLVAGVTAIAALLLFAGAVSADTTNQAQTGTSTATATNQTTTVIIPGYCFNAPVTVTTDQSGNATYTCTATGQTIYPFATGYAGYGYYGYGFPYGAGWIPPGTYNGITCNGLYGCPLGISPYYGGTYVTGNVYCGLYTCGLVEPIKR